MSNETEAKPADGSMASGGEFLRAQHSGAAGGDIGPILLGKRYEIDPQTTLPELNTDQGMVYSASAVDGTKGSYMALVSRSPSGGRTDILSFLRDTDHPAILKLADAGVASFGSQGQHFVLIYDLPSGPILMPNLASRREPMSEEEIVRCIIAPGVGAIRELSQRGVFHGAIRPSNMYFSIAGKGGITLGDCAATIPSLNQPVLFETVERGMADAAGRGLGTTEEDLYALGVTAVLMLRGENPLKGYSDTEIIRAKLEKGSYSALLQDFRVPSGLLEPLRAMLCDDPKYRWSCDDFELWLSGRRLTPVQAHVPRRAQRPITFNEEEFWLPEVLGHAMSNSLSSSIKMIESGELDRWLMRSFGDKALADRVREGVESAASVGRNASFEDRVVSRVVTALHPAAPMRLRDVATLPSGFGYHLGHTLAKGGDVSALAEILKGQIGLFWYNSQAKFKPEYMPAIKQFDQARAILLKTNNGFGIERVAYELCPTLPCLSEIFSTHMVLSPAEVLYALDHVAAAADRPRVPMDRHIAAFLGVRDKKVSDDQLGHLQGDPQSLQYVTGALTILAGVQKRHNTGAQKQLCHWMVDLLEPALERFRNRERQQKVREALAESAERGSLAEILAIINNKDMLRKDLEQFKGARREYIVLSREAKKLRRQLEKRKIVEQGPGREAAALVSGVVAMVVIAAILLYNVSVV